MQLVWKRIGQSLAIAALTTMGVAQAYEWQINEDTTFAVGGDIELAYFHTDTGEDGERELEDIGSELEISGAHAFTNSLTAYFELEFEFKADEKSDSPFDTKSAVFGVKSKLGALQFGTWDGVYEEHIEDFLFLDVMEVSDTTVTEDFRTGEVGNAIAYFSPSFNGLSFAVQAFLLGDEDDDDAGDDNSDGQAFQAAIRYEAGRFTANLAYDDNGLDEGADGTFGLTAGFDLSPVTLVAKFESVGEDSSPTVSPIGKEGFMLYGVGAGFDYGPGNIFAQVQQVEPEADNLDSRTEIALNVNYFIADNFYIFAEHIRYDQDDNLGNTTAVGFVYEF